MTGLAAAPRTRGYAIELHEEEDGTWTVLVPDLPGCVAAGDSAIEALAEVGDAIDVWIETAEADGAPIPVPSRGEDEYSGRFVARVPKSVHRALAKQASREGVSLNTLCVAALTQALTGGLFEAEHVRWAVAHATRRALQMQSQSAFDLYSAHSVGAIERAITLGLSSGKRASIPAGMADAMRPEGTGRA